MPDSPDPPRRTRLLLVASSLLVLLITLIDFWLPPEMSVFLFYLLPISVVALRGSTLDTAVITLACSVGWVLANLAALPRDGAWIFGWNAAIRAVTFVLVAYLIVRLRRQTETLRQAEARLQQVLAKESASARIDELTQALNLRGFKERLADEASRSTRFGHDLSLLYLDLDGFKEINDLHGHARGDEILRGTTAAIRSVIRRSDVAGRLGGDEFVVLLPQTPLEGAERCARHIAEALRERLAVSASIGVQSFRGTYPPEDEMLRLADHAMYRVKRSASRQPS